MRYDSDESKVPTQSGEGRAPGLFEKVRRRLRVKHCSLRTEEAYPYWIHRHVRDNRRRHPRELGGAEVEGFLSLLATRDRVAPSTQSQALAALLFLYREVLALELPWMENVVRAKRAPRLPVVLSVDETTRLSRALSGREALMAGLLYGSGLRLMECLRLRVKDVDLACHEITVCQGKGGEDRRTVLPRRLVPALQAHLDVVRVRHERDIGAGHGCVALPGALARKYPGAERSPGWPHVFPAARLSPDPRDGRYKRHHMDENALQRAVKAAARHAGLSKPVSPHMLRHAFATHLVEGGYGIWTVQELPGHKDVATTRIYAHVLDRGAGAMLSPLDR